MVKWPCPKSNPNRKEEEKSSNTYVGPLELEHYQELKGRRKEKFKYLVIKQPNMYQMLKIFEQFEHLVLKHEEI